jgi:Na+-transporting methylmalonyl-CoA/oxaloacetate decarboxylase gamma subunit
VNPITQGLLITAIGMGLVFLAIVLLWGFMNLLVNITADKKKEIKPVIVQEPSDVGDTSETGKADSNQLAKIAAVAVAIAMSSQKQSPVIRPQESTPVSPWQSTRRTQVLSQTAALLNRKSRGTSK